MLSGWTSLRGKLQYSITSKALSRLVTSRLGIADSDLPLDDLLLLRGTLSKPQVRVEVDAVKDTLKDVIVERSKQEIEKRAKDEVNKQLDKLLR